jgi:hypothetical protein
MRFVMLLVMGGALSWPQEDEATKQAIAAVQKAEGKVVIDRDRPGHPVVEVDIWGCDFSGAGLAFLRHFPQLRSLNMDTCPIADSDLVHLQGLTHLETLNLGLTPLTDAGLAHLRGLKNLKSLEIWDTVVTDAGLAHLKDMQRLERLDLSNTAVTDQGVENLIRLTGLRTVYLKGTKVSAAGAERLNKALPKVEVVRWRGGAAVAADTLLLPPPKLPDVENPNYVFCDLNLDLDS